MNWRDVAAGLVGRAAGIPAFLAGLKVYALVALLAAGAGFGACWWLRDQMAAAEDLEEARAQVAAIEAAVKTAVRQANAASAATQKLGEESAERLVEIRTVYRTLEKEVPVYVTQQSDDRCVVPLGFVRLYNAAADGDPAPDRAAAGAPHDSPSGIKLSGILDNDVFNFGLYHQVARQLLDLQEWERQRIAREEAAGR